MSQNRTQMLMRWLCIMGELIFYISEGKIKNPKPVRKIFEELTDGRYVLKIEKRNKRSLSQNKYLHGVLIPEFRAALYNAGYDEVKTDEDAKLIMKSIFLKSQIVNHETGEVIEFIKDTRKLSTIEMAELFERVWKYCAENLNYFIAAPGEKLTIDF